MLLSPRSKKTPINLSSPHYNQYPNSADSISSSDFSSYPQSAIPYKEKIDSAFDRSIRYHLSTLKISIKAFITRVWKRRVHILCTLFLFAVSLHLYTNSGASLLLPYLEIRHPIGIDQVEKLLKLPADELSTLNLHDVALVQHPSYWQNRIFDPRLAPSMAVYSARKHINTEGVLDPTYKIPFQWHDWLDIYQRLTPNGQWYVHNQKPFDCFTYGKAAGNTIFTSVIDDTCQDLNQTEINDLPSQFFPHLKITGPSMSKLSIDQRIVYGGSYIFHSMENPKRIILLGAGPGDSSISIQTMEAAKGNNMDAMVKQYLKENYKISAVDASENYFVSLREEVKLFSEELSLPEFKEPDSSLLFEKTRVIQTPESKLEVSVSDMTWDFPEELTKLQKKLEDEIASNKDELVPMNEWLDHNLYAEMSSQYEMYNGSYPKYFYEAKTFTIKGDHYDWRFFNSPDMTNYERRSALHKMSKAWLRFTSSIGLQTWIAHGTLLGYYYNGMTLNWDTDLDVQVSMDSLYRLARNYNNSLIIDTTLKGSNNVFSDIGLGGYYLDVGSSFFSREYGNGNNAIDARFIDIHTGLYIDITALATSPKMEEITKKNGVAEFEKMVAYNKLDPEKLNPTRLYHCRNKHYYTKKDISPLKKVTYEGVDALIPSSFVDILNREYPKAFSTPVFNGHTFRSKYRLWVPHSVCPEEDYIGSTCTDLETLSEYEITKKYTQQHDKEMAKLKAHESFESVQYPNLRINDWLLRYGMEILAA